MLWLVRIFHHNKPRLKSRSKIISHKVHSILQMKFLHHFFYRQFSIFEYINQLLYLMGT